MILPMDKSLAGLDKRIESKAQKGWEALSKVKTATMDVKTTSMDDKTTTMNDKTTSMNRFYRCKIRK